MKHRITPFLAAALLALFHPAAAYAQCASPAGIEGDIVYNGTFHVLQYCDNLNNWNAMGAAGPGAGGAGCSTPAGIEGDTNYNKTYHMLEWCDGAIWHAVTGATTPSYNNGLVGWWKLDEGAGGTTADSSGNGNTGTLQNSPAWTTSGKINDALVFTAASNEYVSAPDAGLDITGSWTVSAWVNMASLPTSGNAVALLGRNTTINGSENYALYYDYGEMCNGGAVAGWAVSFNVYGSSNKYCAKFTTAPTLGTWYLITGVYDSVAQTLTLYQNGVSVATQSVAGHVPANETGSFALGQNGNDSLLLNGTLDDARVYNRALSAAEVHALYNAAANPGCPDPGLVGWWKFDDASSGTTPATAADSSGNGNTGTLVNAPTWTSSGKIGDALTLVAASTQYVDVPNSAVLNLTGSLTVAGWFNLTSLPASGPYTFLVRHLTSGATPYVLTIEHQFCGAGAGPADILFITDDGAGHNGVACTANAITATGTWYHIVAVRDSVAGKLTIYINGVQVQQNGDGGVNPTSAAGDLYFGQHGTFGEDLDGTIDDVRVYNSALSAAQVLSLYNGTSGGVEGDLMYNATSHVPMFCDGTNWHAAK
jgi:hypothetical protein